MRSSLILQARSSWKIANMGRFPIANAKRTMQPIQTSHRSAVILPEYVGVTFQVYNGMLYFPVAITEEMVGYKLGEFAPTRKRFSYKSSNK
ncbi:hypothetical protein V1514DRAFT_333482 [Lipomyces japonicus]|uniref:mitochondrial 37S ribosomal protein uS19m n=1 Tax=Lipomyces japonicus TaxID=56871 RepID=UPI0034CFDFA4